MTRQLEPGNECQTMSESEPPLVRMIGIERAHLDGANQETKLRLTSYVLLIITEGHGTATVANRLLSAFCGKCFLLGPHQTIVLRNGTNSPFSCYKIAFEAIRNDDVFDRDRELVFEPFSCLKGHLQDLLQHSDADDRLEVFRKHILFQRLLYEVLRRLPDDLEETEAEGAKQAVERTIAYLHHAYREEIGIGRLAQEAKLSRWQYGSLFRALTGESPNRYLNRLRIDHAKRLLAASPSSRISEIAQQAGFQDEYYFSRKFKKSTGLTPTQFAQSRGETPRIFSIQYLGELLALGIRPVGTNRAMLHALPVETDDIPAIDESLESKRLAALAPDLILYPSFLPAEMTERLSRIAPAVEIDWNDDVYTRLRFMGEVLGKKQEAADWITRYKEKARKARTKLRGTIRPGETASAFIYHADRLYVYGSHHFGHTLYEGVGFEPSPGIRALLGRDRNAKWREISFEDLPEYAGDRIFIALADSGLDALNGRQVLEHPAWRNLPAVRDGNSYVVRDLWANYNPVTLDRHLEEMVQCLKR